MKLAVVLTYNIIDDLHMPRGYFEVRSSRRGILVRTLGGRVPPTVQAIFQELPVSLVSRLSLERTIVTHR